jgi:hypothetical protein
LAWGTNIQEEKCGKTKVQGTNVWGKKSTKTNKVCWGTKVHYETKVLWGTKVLWVTKAWDQKS